MVPNTRLEPCEQLGTVNVASGAELDERLSPQGADRLRDGALAIYCDWSSWRKAAGK